MIDPSSVLHSFETVSARCRGTLGPIPRRGGFAQVQVQVQVQAQIAVARMHTWLDGALVLDADIAHTGQRGGGLGSRVLTMAEEGLSSG